MNAPQLSRPSYASWPPPASASNQPVAAAQQQQQQYYVFSADNNHVGPVSADLIARGVAAGKVQNDALVAPVGSSQWAPLTTSPEIVAALALHAPSLGNHDRFPNPPSLGNHDRFPNPPSLGNHDRFPNPPSLRRPASQPGTMLLQQAPQSPRLPSDLVAAPAQPAAQVPSPLEIPPPPKAEATPAKEEKKGLDPRFKLLPLAIFGVFAFLGVLETGVALIFIK